MVNPGEGYTTTGKSVLKIPLCHIMQFARTYRRSILLVCILGPGTTVAAPAPRLAGTISLAAGKGSTARPSCTPSMTRTKCAKRLRIGKRETRYGLYRCIGNNTEKQCRKEAGMVRIMTGLVQHFAPARPRVEKRCGQHCRGLWLASLALGVCLLGLLPVARAELLVYSATDFVRRCPCNTAADLTEVSNGVLIPVDTNPRYFTSVSFPINGQQVCRFSLVYHDINANDSLTARLVRKTFTIGGAPFSSPEIMATVSTAAGALDTVRRVTTAAITSPTIRKGNSFYYVEIEAPTINLNVLGVQIDVRPTCP